MSICDCYAGSTFDQSFDECEGQITSCMTAKCKNTCEGLRAFCTVDAPQLKFIALGPDANAAAYPLGECEGDCDSDEECVKDVLSASNENEKEARSFPVAMVLTLLQQIIASTLIPFLRHILHLLKLWVGRNFPRRKIVSLRGMKKSICACTLMNVKAFVVSLTNANLASAFGGMK